MNYHFMPEKSSKESPQDHNNKCAHSLDHYSSATTMSPSSSNSSPNVNKCAHSLEHYSSAITMSPSSSNRTPSVNMCAHSLEHYSSAITMSPSSSNSTPNVNKCAHSLEHYSSATTMSPSSSNSSPQVHSAQNLEHYSPASTMMLSSSSNSPDVNSGGFMNQSQGIKHHSPASIMSQSSNSLTSPYQGGVSKHISISNSSSMAFPVPPSPVGHSSFPQTAHCPLPVSPQTTEVSPLVSRTALKEIQLSELEVGELIGSGSFSTVRRGEWRGMEVALKIMKSGVLDAQNASSAACSGARGARDDDDDSLHGVARQLSAEYLQEIQTMALVCNHSNVIQLVGVVNEISAISPCIVTAYYANGSVYDKLFSPSELSRDHGIFAVSDESLYPTSLLLQWAIETAQGLHHLHEEHVIHRDVATRNLLLDDMCHVRVADFGFSRTKEAGASKGFTTSELGPVKWMAPEAIRGKLYSAKSDIFSYGVVLYELFVQLAPWADYDAMEVLFQIVNGERMLIPDNVPPQIRELMEICWSHDPMSRPSLPDIIKALKNVGSASPDNSIMKFITPSKSNMSSNKVPTGSMKQVESIGDDDNIRAMREAKINIDDISFYRQLIQTRTNSPQTVSKILAKHHSVLRLIYILLCSKGRSSESVDMILKLLEEFQESNFHLTIAYFWIQILSFLIVSSQREKCGVSFDNSQQAKYSCDGSFSTFCKRYGHNSDSADIRLNDEVLYLQYYSPALIHKSQYVFNLPDLKSFPNII